MYAPLLSTLVEMLTSHVAAPSLSILALGALTYRDVWDASIIYDDRKLVNFFRLRTYHVEYTEDSEVGWVPNLTQVAKGCPSAVGHISSHMSILRPYWLG